MLTSTWPLGKERVEKLSARKNEKERKDKTKMENRCNLTLKTTTAMLGFSVKTVLWDKNMSISSQRLSKKYAKRT